MKHTLRHLTLATAALIFAPIALAESGHDMKGMHAMTQESLQIQHAYVRAVPPGQPNSAAFMTLHNMGKEGTALISASSPSAEVVELHTHIMDGGMMKMRRIERIEIPATGMTELKPGGLHIMLIGLKEQLKPGMKVSMTLNFADGTMQSIEAPVQEVMQSMGHEMNGHHPMQH